MGQKSCLRLLAELCGAALKSFLKILATVHGDIHDIGKNIVRLLLENYGFEVIDLGKDVAPQEILDAVLRHHAPAAPRRRAASSP